MNRFEEWDEFRAQKQQVFGALLLDCGGNRLSELTEGHMLYLFPSSLVKRLNGWEIIDEVVEITSHESRPSCSIAESIDQVGKELVVLIPGN